MSHASPANRLRPTAVALLAFLLFFAGAPGRAAAQHSPARLGVLVESLTPELRTWLKAPSDQGVLVARVEPGSPAAKAGVQVGDVIVEAGGEVIDSPHDLIWQALRAPEGKPLKVALVRKGERKELKVKPRGEAEPYPYWGHGEFWGPGPTSDLEHELHEEMHRLEKRMDRLEKRLNHHDGERT